MKNVLRRLLEALAGTAPAFQGPKLSPALRTLIEELVGDEDCEFDHHGYCQSHLWFAEEAECPHVRGRKLLEETK